MPKSQQVAQHVPYLRRYARALTGSQASGDSYVVAALETLVKEPTVFDEDLNPRVALFRLFSKIWNSVPVNGLPNLVVNPAPAERHLGHISAMPRQAFLLISLEGFSEQDAATILDVDQIAAVSSVHDDIPPGGRWGFALPAKPVKVWFRQMRALARLGTRIPDKSGGNPAEGC